MSTKNWTTSGSDMITVSDVATELIAAQSRKTFYNAIITNGDSTRNIHYSFDGGTTWGIIEASDTKYFNGVQINNSAIVARCATSDSVASDIYAEAW